MLKVNFNFLPDLTTGWSQAMKDSVTDFGGNTFRWIQNTNGNALINCSMFTAVTAVSFVAADKLATTLGFRFDQILSKDSKTITPDQKLCKGLLIKGLVTGGLTCAGSLLYSSLSGHKLPQVIMLATAVAACTVRYFGLVHQGNNQPANGEVAPPLLHDNKADEDTFARQPSNDAKKVTASGTPPLEPPVVTHKHLETNDEEVSSDEEFSSDEEVSSDEESNTEIPSSLPSEKNTHSASSLIFSRHFLQHGIAKSQDKENVLPETLNRKGILDRSLQRSKNPSRQPNSKGISLNDFYEQESEDGGLPDHSRSAFSSAYLSDFQKQGTFPNTSETRRAPLTNKTNERSESGTFSFHALMTQGLPRANISVIR